MFNSESDASMLMARERLGTTSVRGRTTTGARSIRGWKRQFRDSFASGSQDGNVRPNAA